MRVICLGALRNACGASLYHSLPCVGRVTVRTKAPCDPVRASVPYQSAGVLYWIRALLEQIRVIYYAVLAPSKKGPCLGERCPGWGSQQQRSAT